MNILYFQVENSASDLYEVLKHTNHTTTLYDKFFFNNTTAPDYILSDIATLLNNNHYDVAISYLFFPELSDICQKYEIKYACYIYDSPLMNLYTDSIYNSCNEFFIFDKYQLNDLARLNAPHLHYLPLAANIERSDSLIINDSDVLQYSSNISFVGNLYNDNSYDLIAPYLTDDMLAPVKCYLSDTLCNWSSVRSQPSVSDDILNFYLANTAFNLSDCGLMDPHRFLGISMLSRKLAQLERITILNTAAAVSQVDLYTNDSHPALSPDIDLHPPVDYNTTAGKVYNLSKINLNITLPSIESGVPQRVFDVMSYGGFILTNYQPEIDELFELDKDIVVFHSQKEFIEKLVYFLTHENERLSIAINGYQKIRKLHTYTKRVEFILNTIQQ